MKVKELKQLISRYKQQHGLIGYSKLNKLELIEMLTSNFELRNNELVLKASSPPIPRQEAQPQTGTKCQQTFNTAIKKIANKTRVPIDKAFSNRIRGNAPLTRKQKQPTNNKVYVKKSSIEGSGMGLFAKVDINKNEVICQYTGNHLTKEQPTKSKSDYHFGIPRTNIVIDGDTKNNLGKYANDPIEFDLVNSAPYYYG
jgi:hypothetical protein